MEILKDAITPFYERVKRPFIGAYWMAAVAYNWKVWVALLFYKESVNGVDKITFIYSHINWQTLFLYPIFIAIGFLIFGSLLDILAHYWQLLIKKRKRQQEYDIDGKSMIHGETFNRVILERDEALAKYQTAETEISTIKKGISKLETFEIENQRFKLEPCFNYFKGKWNINSLDIPTLFFNFKEHELELIFPESTETENVKIHFLKLYRSNDHLLLLLRNDNYNKIHEALIRSFKNHADRANRVKLIGELFKPETLYWLINIKDATKTEFAIWPNGGGSKINLNRKNPWDESNNLWVNDQNNIWVLDN